MEMDNLEALVLMKEVLNGFRQLRKEDREYLLKKMTAENSELPVNGQDRIKYEYTHGKISKIEAIKQIRNSHINPVDGTPLPLRESKDIVDGWDRLVIKQYQPSF